MVVNRWSGKRVLITGVCGLVVEELLHQVINQQSAAEIGPDNNETELFLNKQYRS